MFHIKLIARPDARMVEVPLEVEAELPREFDGAALLASSGLPRKVKIKAQRDTLKLSTAYRADQLVGDVVRAALKGTPQDVTRVTEAAAAFVRKVRERRPDGASLLVQSNGRGKIEVVESIPQPPGRAAAPGAAQSLAQAQSAAAVQTASGTLADRLNLVERRLTQVEARAEAGSAGGAGADGLQWVRAHAEATEARLLQRLEKLEERLAAALTQLAQAPREAQLLSASAQVASLPTPGSARAPMRRATAVEAFAEGLRSELRGRAVALTEAADKRSTLLDKAGLLALEAEQSLGGAAGVAEELQQQAQGAAARAQGLRRVADEADLYAPGELSVAGALLDRLGAAGDDVGPSRLRALAEPLFSRSAEPAVAAWLARAAPLCRWSLIAPSPGAPADAALHEIDGDEQMVSRLLAPGLLAADGTVLRRARVEARPAAPEQLPELEPEPSTDSVPPPHAAAPAAPAAPAVEVAPEAPAPAEVEPEDVPEDVPEAAVLEEPELLSAAEVLPEADVEPEPPEAPLAGPPAGPREGPIAEAVHEPEPEPEPSPAAEPPGGPGPVEVTPVLASPDETAPRTASAAIAEQHAPVPATAEASPPAAPPAAGASESEHAASLETTPLYFALLDGPEATPAAAGPPKGNQPGSGAAAGELPELLPEAELEPVEAEPERAEAPVSGASPPRPFEAALPPLPGDEGEPHTPAAAAAPESAAAVAVVATVEPAAVAEATPAAAPPESSAFDAASVPHAATAEETELALAVAVAAAVETETSGDDEWARIARGPEAFESSVEPVVALSVDGPGTAPAAPSPTVAAPAQEAAEEAAAAAQIAPVPAAEAAPAPAAEAAPAPAAEAAPVPAAEIAAAPAEESYDLSDQDVLVEEVFEATPEDLVAASEAEVPAMGLPPPPPPPDDQESDLQPAAAPAQAAAEEPSAPAPAAPTVAPTVAPGEPAAVSGEPSPQP